MTYEIFLKFLILQLRLRSTAEGQSFLGPNIRLRPKVKNVATVQHCTKQFKMMPSETVVRTQALANEQPGAQYAGFGTNLVETVGH